MGWWGSRPRGTRSSVAASPGAAPRPHPPTRPDTGECGAVPAQFRITCDATGTHHVTANGRPLDLPDTPAAVEVTLGGLGRAPIVSLHFLAASVDLEGEGLIQVHTQPDDTGTAILDVLDGLDPEDLWQQAVMAPDQTRGPAGALIDLIRNQVAP